MNAKTAYVRAQDKIHITAFSADDIENTSADDIIGIVDGFRGFSLSFIDHESVRRQIWSMIYKNIFYLFQASTFCKTISKINTQVGCYMYAFDCIPPLGSIEKIVTQLESQFTVQVAFFKSPELTKGKCYYNKIFKFYLV